MIRPIARTTAIIGGFLMAPAISVVGGGVASADDMFIGKSYAQVSQMISDSKAKSEVVSVVGDQLERDECTVSGYRRDPMKQKYLLTLYCDYTFSHDGLPGGSTGTQEGRKAKAHDEQVKFLRANPEECVRAKAAHPEWFKTPVEGCENVQ